MPKYQQTEEDFKKHYYEQISLLKNFCRSYDDGKTYFSKAIAISLRNFLYTGQGNNFKDWLNIEKLEFISSAKEKISTNRFQAAEALLIGTNLATEKYLPVYSTSQEKKISFFEWWKMPVLFSIDGNVSLNREKIVMTMANQDGVGHIDQMLNEKYAYFSRHHGFNMMVITGFDMPEDGSLPKTLEGCKIEYIPEVEYATIRQIAHELLETLNEQITINISTGPVISNIYFK